MPRIMRPPIMRLTERLLDNCNSTDACCMGMCHRGGCISYRELSNRMPQCELRKYSIPPLYAGFLLRTAPPMSSLKAKILEHNVSARADMYPDDAREQFDMETEDFELVDGVGGSDSCAPVIEAAVDQSKATTLAAGPSKDSETDPSEGPSKSSIPCAPAVQAEDNASMDVEPLGTPEASTPPDGKCESLGACAPVAATTPEASIPSDGTCEPARRFGQISLAEVRLAYPKGSLKQYMCRDYYAAPYVDNYIENEKIRSVCVSDADKIIGFVLIEVTTHRGHSARGHSYAETKGIIGELDFDDILTLAKEAIRAFDVPEVRIKVGDNKKLKQFFSALEQDLDGFAILRREGQAPLNSGSSEPPSSLPACSSANRHPPGESANLPAAPSASVVTGTEWQTAYDYLCTLLPTGCKGRPQYTNELKHTLLGTTVEAQHFRALRDAFDHGLKRSPAEAAKAVQVACASMLASKLDPSLSKGKPSFYRAMAVHISKSLERSM